MPRGKRELFIKKVELIKIEDAIKNRRNITLFYRGKYNTVSPCFVAHSRPKLGPTLSSAKIQKMHCKGVPKIPLSRPTESATSRTSLSTFPRLFTPRQIRSSKNPRISVSISTLSSVTGRNSVYH